MGYNEGDAERIRTFLGGTDVSEKRTVGGGLGFMVSGHLCCGLSTRGLTLRVGPEQKATALTEPHVLPHRVGSRETQAFVLVGPEGYASDQQLSAWLNRALSFVHTLPEK